MKTLDSMGDSYFEQKRLKTSTNRLLFLIMKYITSKSPFSHEKSIYNLLNYSFIMLFASRCIAKTIKFKKKFYISQSV